MHFDGKNSGEWRVHVALFGHAQWRPAMAHVGLEILGLRNWFFMYCIIKKLHNKITIDYTLFLGFCKKP